MSTVRTVHLVESFVGVALALSFASTGHCFAALLVGVLSAFQMAFALGIIGGSDDDA